MVGAPVVGTVGSIPTRVLMESQRELAALAKCRSDAMAIVHLIGKHSHQKSESTNCDAYMESIRKRAQAIIDEVNSTNDTD